MYTHTDTCSESQKHPVLLCCAKASQRQPEQCSQDRRVAVWKKMGERFISFTLYNNSKILGTGHGNGAWEWGTTGKVASKPPTCCCVSFTFDLWLIIYCKPLMLHTCTRIFSPTEQDLYPVPPLPWPILAMSHCKGFKCTVVFDCM